MSTCPKCGKQTMDSTTYVDYCTDEENCGWAFVYPSIENPRPGTMTERDYRYQGASK